MLNGAYNYMDLAPKGRVRATSGQRWLGSAGTTDTRTD
jgi:hypothetical protein